MRGKLLKDLRLERGLRQLDIADPCEVSSATVSRWESGEVPGKYLPKVAEALGVTVDELKRAPEAVVEGWVNTPELITEWRDQVSGTQMNKFVRLILMFIPKFLDREHWLVLVTTEQFKREAYIEDEVVDAHWQAATESRFVERRGEVEYALRLEFPED